LSGAAVVLLLTAVSSLSAQSKPAAGPTPASAAATTGVVEIRSYNLKPGTRDSFHRLFVEQALPMLGRWQVDVVAYGPSLHDKDSYYLMRAFPSIAERQKSEDAFYGSDEWKQGPREAILAAIDSYTTVVINADPVLLSSLRKQ
jgi:hypothetical protein